MIQEDKIKMNDTSNCVCRFLKKNSNKFCIYCSPDKFCQHLRFIHTCGFCQSDEKIRLWLLDIKKNLHNK